MTTYGTIPSSSSALDSISFAKQLGRSALTTSSWRPWPELLDARALSLPSCSGEARARVHANTSRFAANYAAFVLVGVFLSLLWHPVSLIVFLVCLAAWVFLYFLREDGPLVVLGRAFDDRAVLVALSAATLALLLLTGATANVLVSLLMGTSLVVLHAALWRSEELVGAKDEEAAGDGKLDSATTA